MWSCASRFRRSGSKWARRCPSSCRGTSRAPPAEAGAATRATAPARCPSEDARSPRTWSRSLCLAAPRWDPRITRSSSGFRSAEDCRGKGPGSHAGTSSFRSGEGRNLRPGSLAWRGRAFRPRPHRRSSRGPPARRASRPRGPRGSLPRSSPRSSSRVSRGSCGEREPGRLPGAGSSGPGRPCIPDAPEPAGPEIRALFRRCAPQRIRSSEPRNAASMLSRWNRLFSAHRQSGLQFTVGPAFPPFIVGART